MSNKINTLLVNPPLSLERRYGKDLKKFGAASEPLGLAYIAASLEGNNHPVMVMDCLALNYPLTSGFHILPGILLNSGIDGI